MFVAADLGKRMRYIRKELDLSQRQIAEGMGISTNMYSGMELGTKKINLEHITLFSEYVNVPLTVIFDDCENEQLDIYRKEKNHDYDMILQAFQSLEPFQKEQVMSFIQNMMKVDSSDTEDDIVIM